MSDARADVRRISGPAGQIALSIDGDAGAPVVLMTHSILSSGMMWEEQAALLARSGFRAVRADTRGHGGSEAPPPPYTMDDLVADSVAVLDALGVERVHYVGLSLGAMSGFGLGARFGSRVASLCLCDGRADAPAEVAAPWDERIAIAQREGCKGLARPTTERWFGKPFLDAHPEIARRFLDVIAATSVPGLVGCARAIQKLDYLAEVASIRAPATFIVGANDGALPQAMRDLQSRMLQAVLEIIPDAGHLPNIDQPAAFNAALLRHFQRVGAKT
jgi:3-oxoadipate enol-lactonase